MKFGEIFSFKYESKSKRKYDNYPTVLIVNETVENVYGINLNFIPPMHRKNVIELFNNEILSNFSFDERLVKMVQERQLKNEDERIAHILFLSNIDNRKSMLEGFRNNNIKSERRLLMILKHSFRIYKKENIKNKPTRM